MTTAVESLGPNSARVAESVYSALSESYRTFKFGRERRHWRARSIDELAARVRKPYRIVDECVLALIEDGRVKRFGERATIDGESVRPVAVVPLFVSAADVEQSGDGRYHLKVIVNGDEFRVFNGLEPASFMAKGKFVDKGRPAREIRIAEACGMGHIDFALIDFEWIER